MHCEQLSAVLFKIHQTLGTSQPPQGTCCEGLYFASQDTGTQKASRCPSASHPAVTWQRRKATVVSIGFAGSQFPINQALSLTGHQLFLLDLRPSPSCHLLCPRQQVAIVSILVCVSSDSALWPTRCREPGGTPSAYANECKCSHFRIGFGIQNNCLGEN